MKLSKRFLLVNLILATVFVANAQTISLITATPSSSTTVGAGTCVRIGKSSGSALSSVTTNNPTTNNTFVGFNTGFLNAAGSDNTFVGWGAGYSNNGSTAAYNTFLGRSAGGANTTGGNNTFVGGLTGLKNTTGPNNVFIGFGAGSNNATGGNNVCTGWGSGPNASAWNNCTYGFLAGNLSTGGSNVLIGSESGYNSGSYNVLIGSNSGYNSGSYNVMIGHQSGQNETGSNKLYISNSNTTTPLIWGDFAASQLKLNGKVGVGNVSAFPTNTLYDNYKLFVTGGILTDEIRVALSASGNWPDYVFAKNYKLQPLCELESFIKNNGHLPNVLSAKEVKADGINVGEMARIQQEKIEELTLYLIQQNKEIEELKAQVKTILSKK